MKRKTLFSRRDLLGTFGFLTVGLWAGPFFQVPWAQDQGKNNEEANMELPEPRLDGKISLETSLKERRTVRSFKPDALTLDHLSQLLWAAQGVTDGRGFKRAAPSAGALYPMYVYAVVGETSVTGMEAGIHHPFASWME